MHHFSFANHISAFLCHSFALPVCASQCRRVASRSCDLLRLAIAVHRCSSLFNAAPSPCHAVRCHCTAVHLIAFATHLSALLCLCNSMQSFSVAILRLASPSQALRCNASANQGRQCHALALRSSPHRQCRQSGPFRCCATGRCRAKFHNPTIHEQPFRGCRQEGLRQTRRCCPPGSPHC